MRFQSMRRCVRRLRLLPRRRGRRNQSSGCTQGGAISRVSVSRTVWTGANNVASYLTSQCGEYGDIIIGLAEKSVSGHEWDCKVTKRTDTSPDAITLNMTCSDYNLAATLFPRDPKSEEKKFKEVLVLKKINKNSMSVRKTLNGKFTGASWQTDYCPENWQRSYIESRARAKTEAEQKANK